MPVKKLFTPDQANNTLPLVRRIVADILATGREIRAISPGGPVDDDTIREKVRQLEQWVEELEQIGCYYKDASFEIGLVDFPAVVDGNEVLLCWRSDEPSITHYHGYNDGFAGRKKLPEKEIAHR